MSMGECAKEATWSVAEQQMAAVPPWQCASPCCPPDLTNNNMTVVPHPPYSLDLAPSDFFLFQKLKMKPKGRRFQTEEIQAGRSEYATRKWFPRMLQKLAAQLGSLSSLRRGLLWRLCRPLMSKVSLSVFEVINPETYGLPLVYM